MQHEEILEGLAQIREIACRLRTGTDIVTLSRAMRTVETYCHMMQWQLGGIDDPVLELEGCE